MDSSDEHLESNGTYNSQDKSPPQIFESTPWVGQDQHNHANNPEPIVTSNLGEQWTSNLGIHDDLNIDAPATSSVLLSRADNEAVATKAEEVIEEPPGARLPEPTVRIIVDNAEKHGEGFRDSYLSYEITSCSLEEPEHKHKVRRRYHDFLWLIKKLEPSYLILPPLPDKLRLEFMDRFSPEFIVRRQKGLQRFLERLTRLPNVITNPVFKQFLEADFLQLTLNAASNDSISMLSEGGSTSIERHTPEKISTTRQLLDQIGDVVVNAFSKSRTIDPTYAAMRAEASMIGGHLSKINTLHMRIQKCQKEIADAMKEESMAYEHISETLCGKDGGQTAMDLKLMASRASMTVNEVAEELDTFVANEQLEYQICIQEYVAYFDNVKTALKQRDQRQIEHEDLSDFLATSTQEREQLRSGNNTNASSITSTVSNFLTQRYDQLKGIDPLTSRQHRLQKVDARVRELETAIRLAKEASIATDRALTKEIATFKTLFVDEWKRLLADHSKRQAEHYKKVNRPDFRQTKSIDVAKPEKTTRMASPALVVVMW